MNVRIAAKDMFPEKPINPVIVIGLLGFSIRNHAESEAVIRKGRGNMESVELRRLCTYERFSQD